MEYIRLGGIANTHGLKGALKIKSLTDFKKIRYKKGNSLYINFNNEMKKVVVDSFREAKGLDVVTFVGLNDINLVEKYKGSQIYFEDLGPEVLDEDEYLYRDLLNMEVYFEDLIGTVKEIRDYPQGEIIVVRRKDDKDVLVPFRKEFVGKVDLKNRKIYVINMEGLL
ncbi:MAG: ribosome maturation factor RimM [Candidatus Izemoplasma sp.]